MVIFTSDSFGERWWHLQLLPPTSLLHCMSSAAQEKNNDILQPFLGCDFVSSDTNTQIHKYSCEAFFCLRVFFSARLVIPAGILRIPVFSSPVALFSQESRFLFLMYFLGTPSGILSVQSCLYQAYVRRNPCERPLQNHVPPKKSSGKHRKIKKSSEILSGTLFGVQKINS